LIDGVPLDEWGRRVDREADSHRARLKRKLEVAIQICRAVAHAHVHAVIHRDLKPTNILIDGRDRASVLDFGVAHAIDGVDRPVTVTGEFTGTLAYSAPEELQRTGAASDARTDIYSLGVLIHQLVTGHLPHDDGLPVHGLIEAIVHQQAAVRPADSTGNRIGRDLETILLKALSNDPDRRYQSGAALADDLVRFLEGAPIEARRDSTL
ncbi:MAG: protein kinase, partial [Planctomycetes bacterium]|nr:protein kinase [Planctomycetota bacterium]